MDMQNLAPLIRDLAVILAIAGLVTFLFQLIRQPIVLGYLIAGIIVGPHTGSLIYVTDTENLQTLAELGVIFLIFSLGLEFSFRKLSSVGCSATVTGVIEVLLMMAIGFTATRLLGWNTFDAIFFSAGIAISSTTIILKALDELKLRKKPFADFIFAILIIEDLLAILLLAALTTLGNTSYHLSTTIGLASIKLILIVGGWFIIGYFILPAWINRISKIVCNETLTIIAIALCLSLATLAARFNYSLALGSFIMGSILAETRQIRLIERLIEPIRNIFGAIFFVSVGMLIDPSIVLVHWKEVLILVIVVILGKIFSTCFAALVTGQNFSNAIRFGLSMAQIGEFSFIIVGLGNTLHLTTTKLYPVIVALSGITTFATPYFIRASDSISHWVNKRIPPNFHFFLDRYSHWFCQASREHQHNAQYRRSIFQCLSNSIVIAILFISTANYILPFFDSAFGNGWISDSLAWFGTIIASLPFFWGMIFAFKSKKLYIFPALLAFIELTLLSLFLFDSWIIAFLLFFAAAGFFFLFYRRLEISYRWFEKHLLRNLNHQEKLENTHNQFHQALPWENPLIKLIVDYNSEVAYKTLHEIKTREKYGINIVAIQRDEQVIFAPRGKEIIYPLDLLLVLGEIEALEAFKILTERRQKKQHMTVDQLHHFSLKSFVILSDSLYVGKSIRDSGIREEWKCIVAGLERNGKRYLNPSPNMVFQAGDVVLLILASL